jgi:N-acyl-D-amino-acid deacylase
MFDLIINGAEVIDGSGRPPFRANLGISSKRIKVIAKEDLGEAKNVINADGQFVCPGWVDFHSHSDLTLLADGRALGKILQGVTTEVCGNCGFSVFPRGGEAQKRGEEFFRKFQIQPNWKNLTDFTRGLNGKIAVNYASLTGHGNIRAQVMGYTAHMATQEELREMRRILEDCLYEGSFGLSSGLIYPPGCFADKAELTSLAEVVESQGALYSIHIRGEGDHLLQAIEEAIEIARNTGVSLHISHLKAVGKSNWSKMARCLSAIEKARNEDCDITCDCYPYTASSTDLDSILPIWVKNGGYDKALEVLSNTSFHSKIKEEMRKALDNNFPKETQISKVESSKNKWMEGMRISDIIKRLKCDICDFLLDILLQERMKVQAIFFSISEENLKEVLKKPYTIIGSDAAARPFSGPLAEGLPHPRSYGTFPRVISRYVKKEGCLKIEEAIYKMTGLPATRLGLRERGLIKRDYIADLVIFDLAKISDSATYSRPFQEPKGLRFVICNGEVVVQDGNYKGCFPGEVLKRT